MTQETEDGRTPPAATVQVAAADYRLFHLPLSPGSRFARLMLGERRLGVELTEERVWENRRDFLRLNPAGEVPVLVTPEGEAVSGVLSIADRLVRAHSDAALPLLSETSAERAETLRLFEWFDRKFSTEVSDGLLYEKVTRRFLASDAGGGAPSMAVVRAALQNLRFHLDYLSYLMEGRNWLAGDRLTLADLMAAAQISCLDYFGDVPWGQYPEAKTWYSRLKSRPSFRPLLQDQLQGLPPPRAYVDLDF